LKDQLHQGLLPDLYGSNTGLELEQIADCEILNLEPQDRKVIQDYACSLAEFDQRHHFIYPAQLVVAEIMLRGKRAASRES